MTTTNNGLRLKIKQPYVTPLSYRSALQPRYAVIADIEYATGPQAGSIEKCGLRWLVHSQYEAESMMMDMERAWEDDAELLNTDGTWYALASRPLLSPVTPAF